jgi:hypothetical protein
MADAKEKQRNDGVRAREECRIARGPRTKGEAALEDSSRVKGREGDGEIRIAEKES